MASMQSTPSSSDPEQAVRAEQLRLLFETRPFNAGAAVIIAAIVAMTMLPVMSPLRIVLWCGVLIIGNIFRVAITVAWRRDAERDLNTLHWWRYLLIATLLMGIAWGLCNFLLFPVRNPPQQMLLVFVICGISAAAAVSLAPDRRIAWSFLIPCILPLELRLYTHSSGFGVSLSAMGLVYLIFVAGVVNRLHNYIRDNIVLRLTEQKRERMQSEFAQALRASQEKLRALFELSPLGCVLMRVDGTLIEANRAFHGMLGYSDEELERTFSAGLTSEAYREEARCRFQQLIRQGGAETFECEFVRQDGSLVPVALHRMAFDGGDGQHYVWTLAEDITERKQYEEQLLALNNRLSLATQAGGIGVWEMDVVHKTLEWDERTCEIYGVEPMVGPVPLALPGELLHPDDANAVMTAFQTALSDPAVDHFAADYRIIARDDRERSLSAACVVQRDESGRVQRVIGVMWDVTEIRRVERMKSEFVSTVSHELRTPLTSIRGSLGLVASGVVGELPTAARDLIDIAYKNSERLSLLIDDILDIEKNEAGKMRIDLQRQALRPLLEQAVAVNQGFAQNFSIQLLLNIERDAMVAVDANRFMQVMANLISNAVKFSNTDDSVEIAVVDAHPQVRIEVRDRGPGISANFRGRIFQRFSQADSSDTRARSGSGLGLAITKTLVEKMHGKIGFSARDGGGTIFFVELPHQ